MQGLLRAKARGLSVGFVVGARIFLLIVFIFSVEFYYDDDPAVSLLLSLKRGRIFDCSCIGR